MSGEKFCLRWNDFESSISGSLREIRDAKDFFDVTLVCDEEQIQAHKVIISACSPYFKSMLLKQRSALHPVLIMPDTVRFEDIISILDFMYHGEVSVPSDELNIFLNTAKQFKVRGLADENTGPAQPQRMRPVHRPGYPGVKMRAGPGHSGHSGNSGHSGHSQPPVTVPPDIRQRLPPGIQMVKRPAFDSPPEKRQRLNTGGMMKPGHSQHQQYLDEEEDDITEIREDEEGNEFVDEYGNEYDDSNMGYDEDGATMPPAQSSSGVGSSGPAQLMGLICPKCKTMCKGVPALKEHMQGCTGARSQHQPQPGAPPVRGDASEEPQECHICDKSFKSHRTLDNHMKKQHGLAAPAKPLVKGRGRPKKSPAMSSGDWQGDNYDGYQESGVSGVAQPHQRGRPVGQVAPVRVSDVQPPSRASQPSTSAAGEGMKNNVARGGKGRGLPVAGRGQIRRPGEDKPDLQKLGMKFGGQISITSSNQSPGGKKQGDGGQGVSVTKMKGDMMVGAPVSIKDATSTKAGTSKSSSSTGESSKADSATSNSEPNVKEEPKDVDTEVAENFDDYGDGDYGDGNEEDYVGPGAEYLDDPDFTGEEVDGDGVDEDLYNQYKHRGEGEYEEDEEPLDDEYEEET